MPELADGQKLPDHFPRWQAKANRGFCCSKQNGQREREARLMLP